MPKSNGLDGRQGDQDGRMSAKHGNTRVGTLREIYGENFAPGVRSDAHLSTLLDRTGSNSLSDYRRNHNK